MSPSPFSQPDLFGDDEALPVPSPRAVRAHAAPSRRSRGEPLVDHEGAVQALDAHDDYRVLRRLRPRPVDPVHQLKPGEALACIVDVETTGLDHRNHEVIELGIVVFVHDAAGRVGPVVGALGMLQEPEREITPEITRLTPALRESVAARGAIVVLVTLVDPGRGERIALQVDGLAVVGAGKPACSTNPDFDVSVHSIIPARLVAQKLPVRAGVGEKSANYVRKNVSFKYSKDSFYKNVRTVPFCQVSRARVTPVRGCAITV